MVVEKVDEETKQDAEPQPNYTLRMQFFEGQDDDEDVIKPIGGPPSAAAIVTSPQQGFTIKNDTPQRFWNFVEPYCAPIQASDVKFLEDLIKGYSEIGEFYKIPGLGPHYSIRWAKEDLERENNKSSEASEDDKATSSTSVSKFDSKSDSVPFGDLTQRLIQGKLMICRNYLKTFILVYSITIGTYIHPNSFALV